MIVITRRLLGSSASLSTQLNRLTLTLNFLPILENRLYRHSTSSFVILATQSAQLSSSDLVLFDTDDGHPKGELEGKAGR